MYFEFVATTIKQEPYERWNSNNVQQPPNIAHVNIKPEPEIECINIPLDVDNSHSIIKHEPAVEINDCADDDKLLDNVSLPNDLSSISDNKSGVFMKFDKEETKMIKAREQSRRYRVRKRTEDESAARIVSVKYNN